MLSDVRNREEITSPPRWRTASFVAVLALFTLLLVYWQTYASIVSIWMRSDTFAHGFFIVPISLYLIWLRRQRLAAIQPRPAPWVVLLLAGLVFGWFAADLVDVMVVKQLMAVAMIPAVLWLLLGAPAVRAIAFPLAYLIFAVPMGENLVPVLQDITAAFSVKALQLTGMPVHWEGRFIHIPSGSFEVAEACSGVRYLIASVALGVLYAYISYQALWRRLVFILLAIVVPIIANGLRAYGIIMLAHHSNYKYAVGADHLIYGWIFFGLVMLLLFWGGRFLAEREPGSSAPQGYRFQNAGAHKPGVHYAWVSVAILVMSSGPVAAHLLSHAVSHHSGPVVHPPQATGDWRGPIETSDPLQPVFVGPLTDLRVKYQQDGKSVLFYHAHYAAQGQGAELISTANKFYNADLLRRIDEKVIDVTLNDGKKWTVRSFKLQAGNRHYLLWQWYEIGGKVTTNPAKAKLYEALARLTLHNEGSAAVMLATEFEVNQHDAHELLKAFMEDMGPAIKNLMI